jgi:hypothetical protein
LSKQLFPILCLLPSLLPAADESSETEGLWTGQGELGFTATSGNTDSEKLNASLRHCFTFRPRGSTDFHHQVGPVILKTGQSKSPLLVLE